jgi:hypothetical protein
VSGLIRSQSAILITLRIVRISGHLVALDFAPEVTAIVPQPFWLCWRSPAGKASRHAPDFWARLADGGALVIDSRPRGVAGDRDLTAFAAEKARPTRPRHLGVGSQVSYTTARQIQ